MHRPTKSATPGQTAMSAGVPARAGDVAHRHAVVAGGVDHSKVGVQEGRLDAGLGETAKQGPVQCEVGEADETFGWEAKLWR